MKFKVIVNAEFRKNMYGLGMCFDGFTGKGQYPGPWWFRFSIIFIWFFWQVQLEHAEADMFDAVEDD